MPSFDSMVDDSQPQATPQAPPANTGAINFDALQDDSEKYNTPGQQAIAGVEGIAKGVAGPLATATEKYLLNVPEEDIKGREAANPVTHGAAETLGLVGGMLTGAGEAAVMGKAGELVSLGAKGLTAAAVRGAAEMAVLQSGDEVSKMIVNDPAVSSESAISNIGMTSAIGGVTGLAFGAVSPLWKATVGNKIAPILEDIKGRLDFHLNNPDMVSASQKELQNIHSNVSDTIKKLYSEEEGGIRGEQIAKAMPEVSEKATTKIDRHMSDVNNLVEGTINKMDKDVKVKSKVPYLTQDLEKFQSIASNPEATYIDKFNAVDDLKKTMQGYSKYGASVEDSAFSSITKKLAAEIRPTLENPEIWGKAANIQKDINESISKFIPAQRDMLARFTTEIGGERVIDPSKINTYINQLGKPQAEIKQEMMKNYLDKSSDLINTVNKTFTDKGLDAPFKHTSTAVLSDTIGEKSTGAHVVDKIIRDNLKDVLGKSVAGGVGAIVGSHLGQPVLGALAGEHLLGPVFKSMMPGLSKPLMEMPSSVNGIKSALDYGMAVAKGEKAVSNSVKAILKPGMQVLTSKAIPTQDQRDKLDRVITNAQKQPIKFMTSQQGSIGDYLPAHQGTLAMTTTRATEYLQSLKPHPFKSSPLDRPIEPSKVEVERYDRALNVAQNPSIVLQHVKDGTIQTSDIQDLNAMYPALYKRMSEKLSNELTTAIDENQVIPYRTKVGISLFLGQPMDTSMTPSSIQDAQLTHMPPQAPQGSQNPNKSKKGTSTLGKSEKSYKTPMQAAEADKSNRR